MAKNIELGMLLVPTDFSPPAWDAFLQAQKLISASEPVIVVLHVLDPTLIEFAVRHELVPDRETLIKKMRELAEVEMEAYRSASGNFELKTLMSEGPPFLEITRKADDFDVDAIVMGKIGWRGQLEHLLFGSTAERVMRASRRPVIVLPMAEK